MIIANTNYNDTISKIEQLKLLMIAVQKSIENQIPQGITTEFEKSKSELMNWVQEIEFTLNEFKKTK